LLPQLLLRTTSKQAPYEKKWSDPGFAAKVV
jgi:hypothetical protein